jgi:hypothetical protein
MHQALRKEFDNLRDLALKKGVPLALIETQLEHVTFISSGKKLVCLVIEEGRVHNTLTCFKVNKNKWAWAESEGFSLKDGIPDDIANEILIKFKTAEEYLIYLGL